MDETNVEEDAGPEIDRTASQVDPQMKAEDKGYARTAMMGSTLGKSEVAEF